MRKGLAVLLLILGALPVYAQTNLIYFRNPLSITIDAPVKPHSSLEARVKSTTLDLARAEIVWYLNDEPVGEQSDIVQQFEIGELGRPYVIRVNVVIDGEEFVQERQIMASEVDLLWEGTSYVPNFYRGRALAAPETTVRAEALARLINAEGNLIEPRNIVYVWRKNGALLERESGRGKKTITLKAPLLFSTDTLTVEARSLDDALYATADADITSTDPFVLLYPEHPLFGLLSHQAIIQRASFPDSEMTFSAVPFFTPDSEYDPLLSFTWIINDTRIDTGAETPHRITLGASEDQQTARIELSLSHRTNYFIEPRGAWDIALSTGFGGLGDLFGTPTQ